MEDAIGEIMPFSEYHKTEHETPYPFHLEKSGVELDYYGVAHTNDPESPILDEIRSRFEAFTDRHDAKDAVVVIEGGLRSIESAKDADEAARQGEPGFLQFLAERAGMRVISPEASDEAQVQAMRAGGFGPDEITTWSMLRDITFAVETVGKEPTAREIGQWYLNAAEISGADWARGFPSKEELRARFSKDPDAVYKIADEIGETALERLRQVFKESTGVEFAFALAERYDDPADFSDVGSVFNRLAAISSEVRDKEIVRAIGREIEDGKSVFVAYGASHAVMQEPAFRKLFENLESVP